MKKMLVIGLGILGVAFLALAVYYFRTPASSLPVFIPGHEAGVSAPHMKHGIAAAILGIGCGILAWFMSGKQAPSEPGNSQKD